MRFRSLSVRHARRVDNLDWIAALPPLTQLSLEFLPQVRALGALRHHSALEALDVSGSIWRRVTVDSFEPIGGLDRLRFLSLTNVAPVDGSLVPIGGLTGLQQLRLSMFYPWKRLAWLAGRLPEVECMCFAPFVPFEHRNCTGCGSAHVMLTGKRLPTMCPRCDAERLGRHVDRFIAARAAAKAGAERGGAVRAAPSDRHLRGAQIVFDGPRTTWVGDRGAGSLGIACGGEVGAVMGRRHCAFT